MSTLKYQSGLSRAEESRDNAKDVNDDLPWIYKPIGTIQRDFPGGITDKESVCQCKRHKRCEFDPWVEKIPWRKKWEPSPLLLPGESDGQRSLADYSPQGHKESDMTEVTKHALCSQTSLLLVVCIGSHSPALASLLHSTSFHQAFDSHMEHTT